VQARGRLLAALLAAGLLAGAGCGDDDDSDGGNGGSAEQSSGQAGNGGADAPAGSGTRIALSADPGGAPEFDKTSLSAKPGTVTIAFDNPSEVPHAVDVEGSGVEEASETVTDASTKLTLDLKEGEYEFYCPVGNHEQQGMKGTLTVR
jgi:plastocyanin